jgi:hypothetical protein
LSLFDALLAQPVLPALYVEDRVKQAGTWPANGLIAERAKIGDRQRFFWRLGKKEIAERGVSRVGVGFELAKRGFRLASLPLAQSREAVEQILDRQAGALVRPAQQLRLYVDAYRHPRNVI